MSESYDPGAYTQVPQGYGAQTVTREPDIDLSSGAGYAPDGDDERSIGDLLSSLTSDVSNLMSTQMQLAVTEIKDEVRQTSKAATFFGAGAMAGYLALILVAFAAAFGLAEVMATGWAFLIVGVVFAAVAFVLYQQGRKVIEDTDVVPPQTVESLKEDVQWLKQQRS